MYIELMKYSLEIYSPNSTLDVIATFEADSPFISIEKGHILNPAFFSSYDNSRRMTLQVINVEHIIWQHEGSKQPTQKVCIFTKEIDNNPEVRLG
jgi:hypothetical protein